MRCPMRWPLTYGETNFMIHCDLDLKESSLDELVTQYDRLIAYINSNPLFKASYEPVEVSVDAPEIAALMAEAAGRCGVGPMAAVAGAFAELVGRRLSSDGAADVIVENGGDIYMLAKEEKTVGIYSGPSSLSGQLAFLVKPEDTPCGICTSSASVGPSVSLGAADSATAVADSAALADAAATAVGNAVKSGGNTGIALETAKAIPGLRGVVVVSGDVLAAWGRLPELTRHSL